MAEPERFWSRVDASAGPQACWPWTGAVSSTGYGIVRFEGKNRLAHRLAYAFERGIDPLTLPPSTFICHACDNPRCCNPAHLWPGTALDNVRDRDQKGRTHKGRKPGRRSFEGEANSRARLRASDVAEIRRLWREGWSSAALGARFGVVPSYAWRIAVGRAWRSAPMQAEKAFADRQAYLRARSAGLLVLDEVPTQPSDERRAMIHDLVDRRQRGQLTLVLGNGSPAEWNAMLDERTRDRLAPLAFVRVLKGASRRAPIAKGAPEAQRGAA